MLLVLFSPHPTQIDLYDHLGHNQAVSDTVAIAEVKARFAEYVRRAERGESIVLTRHGRRVARLGPVRSPGLAGTASEVRELGGTYTTPERQTPGRASSESRRKALRRVLERDIWPRVPEDQLGRGPDRKEREEILGYGSDGL